MELEISQSQLAERLRVRTDTIRNWERNRTSPALGYLPMVLEFLGYDPAPIATETLGEKLLKYRRDRGITQKELAQQIGIDPTTLSRLERNQGKRFFQNVLKKVNDFLREHS